jgi:hypothetical protein
MTLVTAVWLGAIPAYLWTEPPNPVSLSILGLLGGGIGLACLLALSRALGTWWIVGSTDVEVSSDPVAAGDELRVFVVQRRGHARLRRFDLRLLCRRSPDGGRNFEIVRECPVGSAVPEPGTGGRAQLDAAVRVPADAEPTLLEAVRWSLELRVGMEGAADLIEDYAIRIVSPRS